MTSGAVLALGLSGSAETAVQTALVLVLLAFSVLLSVRSGMFSLAGVGFYGIGAYTAAVLSMDGLDPALAVLAAVAGSAVLGVVLAYVLGRLRALYLAMATFAFVLLVQVLAVEWEPVTGGALGLLGVPAVVDTGTLLLVTAVCAAGVALLERGRSGRILEVMRIDDTLAEALGVAVVRRRRVMFTVSCALGGLAGALSALTFSVLTPDEVSFGLIVDVLTIIVVGGTAAWYGPVIGAFVVVWLPELLGFLGEFRPIVQAALVVVIVVCAPDGAVGLVRSIRARLTPSTEPPAAAAADPIELGKVREYALATGADRP
ncbi:branched-chain amino acid ABC transporter permease, partial [Pseudonocardia pini]|uniref:branched-chain amino acid ABC transporter permease n=1 Tax=Pseudonocardia pini TaxID=2758030 RepID=UPI0015F0F1B3